MDFVCDVVAGIARQDALIGKVISTRDAQQSGVAVSSRSHSATPAHTSRRLHIPGR